MGMRTPWALLTTLLAAPLALAAQGVDYASATSVCQPLRFVPLDPPDACPRVQQSGTATAAGCDGARCSVDVHAFAWAQGLPLGLRTLVSEAQLASGAEPATRVCATTTLSSPVSCQGDATLDLPVEPGSCTDFHVRAILSDVGEGDSFALRLQTDYNLRACRDAGVGLTIERG